MIVCAALPDILFFKLCMFAFVVVQSELLEREREIERVRNAIHHGAEANKAVTPTGDRGGAQPPMLVSPTAASFGMFVRHSLAVNIWNVYL